MWMTTDEAAATTSGRKQKMTRFMTPETFVDFEDVEFKKESAKAVLCKFPEGHERWVPISQTPQDFSWTIGETGTLTVSQWISDKWDAEGPPEAEPDVTVDNCVVMKETARALLVAVPGAAEHLWFPKGQIRDSSECKNDGDRGKLVISEWIANQKGLGENAPVSYESVAHDVGRQREARAPRGGGQAAASAFDADGGDDDIPFIRYWP
jgi:hypothetical protein